MSEYIKTLRQSVGHAPILQCGACVFIVNEKEEILLEKRRDNGCWGLPGGAVELDEAVEEAAKRELFEETGLFANTLELFGVYSGKDMHYTYPNGDEVSNVDHAYICRDYSGKLKAQHSEVAELCFFSIKELPENISPPQCRPIKEYAGHIQQRNAKRILANWKEAHDLDVTCLAENVWRVGSDYILKSGKREWILRSIHITKALARQGFSVGEPILSISGTDYIDDNEQLWVLCHAVRGEPLEMSERFGERYREFAYQFGEAIAKLHKALADISEDTGIDDVDMFQHVTGWAMPKANVNEEFVNEYISGFRAIFPKLPKQLIHRDTHPENILWHDGKVSGFIDFDIAQRNVRLWDVCYCSTALLPDCPHDKRDLWFDVLREMLSGYDSVAILTDAEKQAVYYVICSVQLVFIAWGTGQEKYNEMTKVNRENLRFVVENKARITGIFAEH